MENKITVAPGRASPIILSRQRLKRIDYGLIVPAGATEAEGTQLIQWPSDESRLIAHLFPSHVPLNPDLFHGGFAILIFRDPAEVVTGVKDGPASRAGIRQSDAILSVNDIDSTGKSSTELEALFSNTRPKLVRLRIDRARVNKVIEYKTEKVSEILIQDHLRLVERVVIPAELAEEDIHCFREKD